MRKGKFGKEFVHIKIIFISIILSMSILGVGYASWNDSSNFDLTIKTGFLNPIFLVNDETLSFDDGELNLSLSDNRYTLIIDGDVYPTFNENIKIEIIDEGSIPSVFRGLKKDNDNISDLSTYNEDKYSKYNDNSKNTESFELEVRPNTDDNNDIEQLYFENNEDISSLEEQIIILEKEIEFYEQEKDYEFQYILNFEQGI